MPKQAQWWLAKLKKKRFEGEPYIPTMVPIEATSEEEAKSISQQEGCLDYGLVGPFPSYQELLKWFL